VVGRGRRGARAARRRAALAHARPAAVRRGARARTLRSVRARERPVRDVVVRRLGRARRRQLSPDGKKLAFTARGAANEILLWIRPIESLEADALPGTSDAALPFWSPDSRSIGFFANGALKRIAATGDEAPRVLAAVARGQGGTWNSNGTIVFVPTLRSGLLRVDEDGGETAEVLHLAAGHTAYRFPYFLPGGEKLVYHVDAPRPEDSGIYVTALERDGAAPGLRLLAADSAAEYVPPGQLLLVRHGTLFAQPFDAARGATVAQPEPIADGISAEGSAPAFSASTNGVLTYRIGPADSDRQQLVWLDRAGNRIETVGPTGTYRGIDLSPDGSRIAVHDHRGSGGDIWVIEPRGTATRVTFEPEHDNNGPVWSPDGSRIAFGSVRDGRWGLYHAAASGAGDEVLIAESPLPTIPASWSPDGAYLVSWRYDGGSKQWLQPITGDSREARPLLENRYFETHSQVSPDGRWIAYMTSTTGRAEVFLRTFPAGDGLWQVSTSGGLTPRWRADGKELYYMTAYDQGQVMAVSFNATGGAPEISMPQRLFDVDLAIVPHSNAVQNFHPYDVSPDGERFVLPLPVSALQDDELARITVVVNWPALLER
jgi:Tol biopolymer transport system component